MFQEQIENDTDRGPHGAPVRLLTKGEPALVTEQQGEAFGWARPAHLVREGPAKRDARVPLRVQSIGFSNIFNV